MLGTRFSHNTVSLIASVPPHGYVIGSHDAIDTYYQTTLLLLGEEEESNKVEVFITCQVPRSHAPQFFQQQFLFSLQVWSGMSSMMTRILSVMTVPNNSDLQLSNLHLHRANLNKKVSN